MNTFSGSVPDGEPSAQTQEHTALRFPAWLVTLIPALFWCLSFASCTGKVSPPETHGDSVPAGDSVVATAVKTGAESILGDQFDMLKGKRVAIVANQTSLVKGTHLVDSLKSRGVNVVKVFAPEHGFRGDQDAGKKINNTVDEKTGIPLVSLYGNNKKPTPAQLADVDLVLFDIQDVGARFYTYISTLTYVQEACAENKKRLIVLDRPNPNGWYVDGPVLEQGLETFVGLHHIPIVHGMTVGEYARMLNGEGWLTGKVSADLVVIPCKGYNHKMKWEETGLTWVAPSPNLASEYSAYLYPMLCWYEGMPVSIGRGTDAAFTLMGAPWHQGYNHQLQTDSVLKTEAPGRFTLYGLEAEYIRFTPRSLPGKATHPPFEDKVCYGARFINRVDGKYLFLAGLSLLLNYEEESRAVSLQEPLFQPFFDNISGSRKLKTEIIARKTPEEIYASWQPDVNNFRSLRRKYLLYPDFE